MKKIFSLLLILSVLASAAFSQTEAGTITLKGKPDDEILLAKKKKLEAKGFRVVIEDNFSDSLLTGGNQAFREKHLNKLLMSFKLRDINGKMISSETLKGKFVHINFWSITCAPCIAEFPELNELKKKYQSKDFVFLAIAPEATVRVKKVLKGKPLAYTVIADAQNYFDELAIGGYPKNLFIDKDGIIRAVTDGTRFKHDARTKKKIPDNFKTYDEIMSRMN